MKTKPELGRLQNTRRTALRMRAYSRFISSRLSLFGDELGPNVAPIVRSEIEPRHRTAALPLNENAEFLPGDALTIGDVPQKGLRRSTAAGELIALFGRKAGNE
ncbi:hypothetical protein [Paraburkholderia sp. BCC1885]|uniref:hypothetical protein n=1 Tax=Paraburkholderia sp. BCC1885 TaxID=2562669 RepID=UPI00391F96BE